MSNLLLRSEQLGKAYQQGKEERWIFKNLSLDIEKAQSISLMGPSGSGKSTLLNIFGLLTDANEGTLFFKDQDISNCSVKQKEEFRSSSIGFVFQKHLLLPELSLLENICLPLAKRFGWGQQTLKEGREWLKQFELDHREKARPNQLSGGEAQRGAIIRALIHKPELLLLDEPTGNLDPDISQSIVQHLLDHAKASNCAVLFVTHDQELAHKTERCGQLKSSGIEWA